MKFVRFLLNTLQFIILLIGSFFICTLVSTTLSLQTKQNTTGFVFWSMKDTSVGINDAIGFWGDTIQANYTTYSKDKDYDFSQREFVVAGEEGLQVKDFDTGEMVTIYTISADVAGPKYRCRNWIPWNWYKESVGMWLDYGIDAIAAVSSPILLPTMNVKNVEHFYQKDLYEFREEIGNASKAHGSHYYEDALEALYNCKTEDDYYQWVDNYKVMYDYMFKIGKYNAKDDKGNYIYEYYYNKFIGEDKVMNSSVVLLYYTILIDIIITIWVVIQYPITIKQLDTGEMEASGGMIKRKKRPGFWSRLFKKKENTEESEE